jgi:hypothetical protein
MRNLIIKREKSFVACLGKFKVYIEDANSNELTIKGTTCRKLGDLKNGEEKIFSIEENEAKIFVIADKMSKEYCNEMYKLPKGSENIYLSGRARFNLSAGNAFRFNDNHDDEAIENRNAGKEKGKKILLTAIIIGFIIGFMIGIM